MMMIMHFDGCFGSDCPLQVEGSLCCLNPSPCARAPPGHTSANANLSFRHSYNIHDALRPFAVLHALTLPCEHAGTLM